MQENKCKFKYTIARTHPKKCAQVAVPDSLYCIWHDTEGKKNDPTIATKLEEAITEIGLSTEGFSLRYAQLRGLTLNSENLMGIDFENADLTRADLRSCDLSGAILRNSCLRGSNLSGIVAVNTNFERACLDEANLTNANLHNANLNQATYLGTNFESANLADTLLEKSLGKTASRDSAIPQAMLNPFTPKAGLRPYWFAGREKAMDRLIEALKEAKQGRPDHVVVLGEWAMGKTSLLLWFKDFMQRQSIWASYVPVPLFDDNSTVESAIVALVEGISRGFGMGISPLKKFIKTLSQFGFTMAGIGLSATRQMEYQPATLLIETFQSLWNDLKGRSKCVAILIDDVQQFRPGTLLLSVLKQSLTQLTTISQVNILLVLTSTPSEWLSLTGASGHTPVGRYFSSPPTQLSKLSSAEMIEVIQRTLELTGVKFSPKIIGRILQFADGHPYDLQIICKVLYDAQLGGIVEETTWEKSKAEAEQWLRRIATKREQVLISVK